MARKNIRITPAQTKVAMTIAQGYSNPQAARQLRIAESTLKNHLNAIYKSSGVMNRQELIAACKTGRLGLNNTNNNAMGSMISTTDNWGNGLGS